MTTISKENIDTRVQIFNPQPVSSTNSKYLTKAQADGYYINNDMAEQMRGTLELTNDGNFDANINCNGLVTSNTGFNLMQTTTVTPKLQFTDANGNQNANMVYKSNNESLNISLFATSSGRINFNNGATNLMNLDMTGNLNCNSLTTPSLNIPYNNTLNFSGEGDVAFSKLPICNIDPSSSIQLVNKKYVDLNLYRSDKVTIGAFTYAVFYTLNSAPWFYFVYPDLTPKTFFLNHNISTVFSTTVSGTNTTITNTNYIMTIVCEISLELISAYTHDTTPSSTGSIITPVMLQTAGGTYVKNMTNKWKGTYTFYISPYNSAGYLTIIANDLTATQTQPSTNTAGNLFQSCNYAKTNATSNSSTTTYTPTNILFTPLTAQYNSTTRRILISLKFPSGLPANGTTGYLAGYAFNMRIISSNTSTFKETLVSTPQVFTPYQNNTDGNQSEAGYAYFTVT